MMILFCSCHLNLISRADDVDRMDDDSGVAIGGGWQGLVAYINLGCYYIFGLPLGYLLGYKFNYGVGVIHYILLPPFGITCLGNGCI